MVASQEIFEAMVMKQGMWSSYGFPFLVFLVYSFLYVPLVTLIVFSFNNNKLCFDWRGFTTKWYAALFDSGEVWSALENSLIVAFFAVFLCVSMSAFFVFFGGVRYVKRVRAIFYANLILPEIILAVGLMSIFRFFQIPLGFTTLITAHTVLGLGYVIPIIHDRYAELDKKYVEASLDLGATPWQTFYRIVLPLIFPSLLVSALLVFIISFDDFLLSFFCSSGSTLTLPIYIFAMIRSGSSPVVSALSTFLLLVSGIVVLILLALPVKKQGIL